eukprot:TRINITY_DN1243_c0_g1_i1.p1 TRINITY_DN1243_c0_g1~~TRINITY_DN1243_c0_g1_i1.p1  ORF type:complete len:424 (+),score=68.16 TRINITY_DN1243_c0_g1_i1:97-1368(+)
MREVIHVHAGGAGVQIGLETWRRHNETNGLQSESFAPVKEDIEISNVLYSVNSRNMYNPRAVFVDFESAIPRSARQAWAGSEYFLCKDIMENGFYTSCRYNGRDHWTRACEQIRKQVEQCDQLDSIILQRSIMGGTGSASYAALSELGNSIQKLSILDMAVIAGSRGGQEVVEPYNSMFALSDVTSGAYSNYAMVPMTNEQLWKHCGTDYAKLSDANRVIAEIDAHLVAPMDYASAQFMSVSDLVRTVDCSSGAVPFLQASFQPADTTPADMTAEDLTAKLFQGEMLSGAQWEQGHCVASSVYYRGDWTMTDVRRAQTSLRRRTDIRSITTSQCEQPYSRSHRSAMAFHIHTSFKEVLKSLNKRIRLLNNFRTFNFWYVGVGIREESFQAVVGDVKRLEEQVMECEAALLKDDAADATEADDG